MTCLRDGYSHVPDRPYYAVCFGQPTSAVDTEATNAYVAEGRCATQRGLYPLLVAGRNTMPPDVLPDRLLDNGFFGTITFLTG